MKTAFSIIKPWFFLGMLLCFTAAFAQTKFGLLHNKKSDVVNFRLVNNLIIIPVEVNGTELSFLLDTGVSTPILFNLTENDSIEVKNISPLVIRGLGGLEPIDALRSIGNTFQVNNIYNPSQELYVILEESLDLSSRIGFTVHGIIGYDLFKDFVVEVNYISKRIRFHNPATYKPKKCKKCVIIPLDFYKNKPYIDTEISILSNKKVMANLLIDSGSSDALWLFEDDQKDITVPDKYYQDFLGRGLSGSIYGKRSKIQNFTLGGFSLNEVKVAFPDSLATVYVRNNKKRNGSLGGEILKRFNLVYDYAGGTLSVKKNSNFRDPFSFNMSGIELEINGSRLVKQITSALSRIPEREDDGIGNQLTVYFRDQVRFNQRPNYTVAEIRKDSPGALAGLKEGDVLIKVNNKSTYGHNLQEVAAMLHGKEGEKVRLVVERSGSRLVFLLTLKSLI
jgi:hypothetical protein